MEFRTQNLRYSGLRYTFQPSHKTRMSFGAAFSAAGRQTKWLTILINYSCGNLFYAFIDVLLLAVSVRLVSYFRKSLMLCCSTAARQADRDLSLSSIQFSNADTVHTVSVDLALSVGRSTGTCCRRQHSHYSNVGRTIQRCTPPSVALTVPQCLSSRVFFYFVLTVACRSAKTAAFPAQTQTRLLEEKLKSWLSRDWWTRSLP